MIPLKPTVTIQLQSGSGNIPKRWSTIRYSNVIGITDGIVVRVKKNTFTIYTMEEVECGRLGRIVWLFCLKICVYLKLI